MSKERILELFLLQVILYSIVFFFNAYIGFLLCVVIGCISTAIFILSVILEMIERSRVPVSYFYFMGSAILSPILVLIGFLLFDPNALSWTN